MFFFPLYLPPFQSFYSGANCFVLLFLLAHNYVSIKVYKMEGGERVEMWDQALQRQALGVGEGQEQQTAFFLFTNVFVHKGPWRLMLCQYHGILMLMVL